MDEQMDEYDDGAGDCHEVHGFWQTELYAVHKNIYYGRLDRLLVKIPILYSVLSFFHLYNYYCFHHAYEQYRYMYMFIFM